MPKFAIVATGGKQYKVRPGQTLKVELLPLEVNAEAELEALLLADDEAKDVQVGHPALTESIKVKVLEHGKCDKVTVVKYKNKTRYKRVLGHRQRYTKIEVQNW